MATAGLPATSVALTVNVFVPAVAVSIDEPAATLPVQVAMPEPASAQLYAALTVCPTV